MSIEHENGSTSTVFSFLFIDEGFYPLDCLSIINIVHISYLFTHTHASILSKDYQLWLYTEKNIVAFFFADAQNIQSITTSKYRETICV